MATLLQPNSFQLNKHYYPQVLTSSLSKKVETFLALDNRTIAERYAQIYDQVNIHELYQLLQSSSTYFRWSGGDLFHVNDRLQPQHPETMVLIEMNTCPSGQKSMPNKQQNGYHDIMAQMFKPLIMSHNLPGALAVVYDQNPMEARGYAEALADVMNENVFYLKFEPNHTDSVNYKFIDQQLVIRSDDDEWHPIRAAFRFVTQKPWNVIPFKTQTLFLNPIIACLAGGRNKMLATHAYHGFNEKYAKYGLEIRIPETIINVHRDDVPACIKKLGGMGVIKTPYLNSGQGIFTIVNEKELDRFMTMAPVTTYHSYIVQSLIGHSAWNSAPTHRYSHILTDPTDTQKQYVKDLRMQVCSYPDGFRPTSVYCRRARQPLSADRNIIDDSWLMLGTNLGVQLASNTSIEWTTESERLIVMDENDASGLSLDNLIDGYVQTVFGALAIDQLAQQLTNDDGNINLRLFKSLSCDDELISEILL